jgi:hypothetical protein
LAGLKVENVNLYHLHPSTGICIVTSGTVSVFSSNFEAVKYNERDGRTAHDKLMKMNGWVTHPRDSELNREMNER